MNAKQIIELAGGATVVANLFGIKSQAVSQWRKIPANRVLDLELHFLSQQDSQVTRYDMRADIFGEPPKN